MYSAPCERAEAGGDIHYVSLCGMGLLSRFAVVDLAGHGASVAGMSRSVYGLMNEHINTIDQAAFARSINHEMGRLDLRSRFATAILVSYINADKSLLLCNAGHPPPLYRSAREAGWSLLTPDGDGGSTIDQGDSDADCNFEDFDPKDMPLWLARRLTKERLQVMCDRMFAKDGTGLKGFLDKLLENVPAGLFVLLPLMALFLNIIYPLSKRYYVEHLLFVVHYHAFIFLALIIQILAIRIIALLGLPEDIGSIFVVATAIYIGVYLYKAMRRVYEQNRFVTVLKFIVLFIAYSIGLTLILATAGIIAAFSI